MAPVNTMPNPKLRRTADGWYARYPHNKWMGPWDTAYDAVKYSHRVFCVDCAYCTPAITS